MSTYEAIKYNFTGASLSGITSDVVQVAEASGVVLQFKLLMVVLHQLIENI